MARMRHSVRVALWTLLAFFLLFAASVLVILTVPAPIERWLQGRIQEALRQHYGRDVALSNLHATLIPHFEASFDDFVLPNRVAGLPPFITVRHVTVKAATLQLLRRPVHLSRVNLDGLVIHVPPKGVKRAEAMSPMATGPKPRQAHLANFVIDTVDADNTELYALRKEPSVEPMYFGIRKLTLHSAGVGQPMKFTAELTNDTPPGVIHSTGHFGPWNFDEPSSTKVDGHYTFDHADLSVFNGISGILSSVGDYKGVLNNIIVDGTTDTPDFQLDRGATEVHLTTQFHAVVDGTNGDTYLQPVDAQFLKSQLTAQGKVAGTPGQKGKTIALNVDVHDSYLQDLLALASKSDRRALVGRITFKGDVLVPPGPQAVLGKLKLKGLFDVSDVHFLQENVRRVIVELSRRGQGKPGDQTITDVAARFEGDFILDNARLNFRQLHFSVPGAESNLKGSCGLKDKALDFAGDLRLEATISRVIGGTKGAFLSPLDLIFMRHAAGTYLPVEIRGTYDHPQIKIDWKKLF